MLFYYFCTPDRLIGLICKRMSKADTVNKYIDAFLEGKDAEAALRFREKDINRQYQSIMTWRYNRRKKEKAVEEAAEPAPVEMLRNLRKTLERNRDLSGEQLEELTSEVTSLLDFITALRHNLRLREIEQLERRREEIGERLKTLRREVEAAAEPTLFD